jgi:hypothetical protein
MFSLIEIMSVRLVLKPVSQSRTVEGEDVTMLCTVCKAGDVGHRNLAHVCYATFQHIPGLYQISPLE